MFLVLMAIFAYLVGEELGIGVGLATYAGGLFLYRKYFV